jgi:hypothetical protein
MSQSAVVSLVEKLTNFEYSTLEILKNLDLSDKHQSRADT